jgi:O-antigen ligase
MIMGLLGGAFALSVFHYLGPTVHLQLYATLMLLCALVVYAFASIHKGSVAWSALHTVMAGYVVWLLVLTYTSTLPGNSIMFFWLLASLPIVLLLCSEFNQQDLLRVFHLFLLGGITTAGWGIAEFVSTGRRADGPLIDPNLWCAINNLLFFGVLAAYLSEDRHRPIYLVLLLVFSAASFVAYSRVGTLVFGAAFVFAVVLLATKVDVRQRILLAIGMVFTSFILVYGSADLEQATSHSEGYTLDTRVQGWSQRLSMWRSAVEIYQEYPVFGTGPGTYKVHYPRFRDANDMTNSGNFVHNDYLQFLSEGGPLLLAFLVALVLFLLVRLVRLSIRIRQCAAPQVREVLLIIAMGTSLVHGLMSFTLFNLSVQMLFGLYLVSIVVSSGMRGTRLLNISRIGLARVASVVIVVYAALVLLFDSVSNDIVYDNYQLPLTRHLKADQQDYLSAITFLKAVRPQNPGNHFALATMYRQRFDLQTDETLRYSLAIASAISYQRGLELNPFNYRVRFYYSQFLQQNPSLLDEEIIDATPESLLQENVRLAPVFIENQLELIEYLEGEGKSDIAYQRLRTHVLPWLDMRHARYQSHRLTGYREIYRRAVARDDHELLSKLLVAIETAR